MSEEQYVLVPQSLLRLVEDDSPLFGVHPRVWSALSTLIAGGLGAAFVYRVLHRVLVYGHVCPRVWDAVLLVLSGLCFGLAAEFRREASTLPR